ncbi:MAG: J domain-containing protein [bacterium]|nr:J domain-containing protein [bacterium]
MPSIFQRLADLLRGRLPRSGFTPRWRPASPAGAGGGAAPAGPAVDPELASLYANLEVPYGADLETVRDGWKRLVRKYHPDLHGADPERQRVATELVKGLNQAFETLRRRLEANRRQTR